MSKRKKNNVINTLYMYVTYVMFVMQILIVNTLFNNDIHDVCIGS